MVVDVMRQQEFPVDDILCADATAAALRDLMGKSKNVLVTLSDEYKMTLGSLKVGTQVYMTACQFVSLGQKRKYVPVMVAIAVGKNVVSIGYFPLSFIHQVS